MNLALSIQQTFGGVGEVIDLVPRSGYGVIELRHSRALDEVHGDQVSVAI